MNSDDFVENYITKCIDNGISKPKAICEVALKEIEEIDKKLRESNLLRIRYKNLKLVLKNFNHESLKRTKDHIPSYIEIDDIHNSPYYSVLIEICEFIEKSKSTLTSREIMDSIGNRENSHEIFGCIKTLADNGIISKNQERHILKGPKWEERPLKSAVNSA